MELAVAGPSLRQMISRANHGHEAALRALALGKTWPAFGCSTAELRGAQVVYRTLRRWGCTDASGITSLGQRLLMAMEAK